MIRKITAIIAVILIIFLSECTQKQATCFKKLGKIDTVSVNLSYFRVVKILDPFYIQLVQDNNNYIEVIARQQLTKNIDIQQVNDTIFLKDNNICYFMHNYDSSHVYIRLHFNVDTLVLINYSSVSLSNEELLNIPVFVFNSQSYLANLNLLLNSDIVSISTWGGTGVYRLHGQTRSITVKSYHSATIFADSLKAQQANLLNASVRDIIVYVTDKLNATILNAGNIYYKGDPIIDTVIRGIGKIIKIQ